MKINLVKKFLFCSFLGSLVFLPGCSFGNLLPWNSSADFWQQLLAPWATEPVEPEVPYPDDSVDPTDPAVSWVVYPGSQLYSDTLSINLCKETEDISYSWMEEPGLMLDPKYGRCGGMLSKNPFYNSDGLSVKTTYFIRDCETGKIKDWFIKEVQSRGFKLEREPETGFYSCSDATPSYYFSFGQKKGGMDLSGAVGITIKPYEICGVNPKIRYHCLGTLIDVSLRKTVLE